MKRFALVWCSENDALDYRDAMVDEFSNADEHWDILTPADPDLIEKVHQYDGFIISGSEKSVVDDVDTPFVARLLTFLRAVQEQTTAPVCGICFGAQAVAAALGGEVGRNPDRLFRLGVESLDWTDDGNRLPKLRQAPTCTIVESHGECVVQLPPDSTRLAGSATIPHEVFMVGKRFLAIQGHPEIDSPMLREHFMPLHRPLFNEERWQTVLSESTLPVHRTPLLALIRRLLDDGQL